MPQFSNAQNFEGQIDYEITLSGGEAATLRSSIPELLTIKIKDNRLRFIQEGGTSPLQGDMIIDGKYKKLFLLRDRQQMALHLDPLAVGTRKAENTFEIELLDEEKEILGYLCQKYLITITSTGGKSIQYAWATRELPFDAPPFYEEAVGNHEFYTYGVEGTILKVVTETRYGVEITTKAVKVNKKSIGDETFEIPKEYTQEDFSFDILGN